MEKENITVFGEALVDHFPDGKAALGGAPFNVAWHLQAFGQKPQFFSRIGDDADGNRIQQAMKKWGLDNKLLQVDSVYPTGQVQVSLENGEPKYNIVPDQAYDHIEKQFMENIDRTSILYHGTLATRSYVSKQTLTAIKILHLGRIFIDVNLRQPWWDKDNVSDLISYADCLKLNVKELDELQEERGDLKTRMTAFLAKYYLQSIIVTCGENGAYALNNNGDFYSVIPKKSSGKVVDTIGAGDAFSAVILLGLNLDWDFQLTLERAHDFANALTKQAGATVDKADFYDPFIAAWELPVTKKPASKPKNTDATNDPVEPGATETKTKKTTTKPKTNMAKTVAKRNKADAASTAADSGDTSPKAKRKKTGAKAGSSTTDDKPGNLLKRIVRAYREKE